MRSMAKWVLPVLVGPSTAVTARDRPASLSEAGAEKATFMRASGKTLATVTYFRHRAECARRLADPYHKAAARKAEFFISNESGTNRGRIGDGGRVYVCSSQEIACRTLE